MRHAYLQALQKTGATGLEPALYPHDPLTKGAVEVLTVGRLTSPSPN